MAMLPLMPAAPARSRAAIFFPVFALALVCGLAWLFAQTPVYVASARVQVDLAAPQRPADEPAGAGLLTVAQEFSSNTVLESALRRMAPAGVVSADALRAMVSVAPLPGTNVLELRAEGGDPDLLTRALTAWIEAWRGTQGDAHDRSASAALEEARAAVVRLKTEVAARREALDEFRRRHGIVSSEREEHQAAARMKSLNTAISEARNREVDAEARLGSLRESLAAGSTPPGAAERSIVVELEKRVSEIRERMKDLEQEYTANYLALDPKYKAMRANLARLQQQLGEERKAAARQAVLKVEGELAGARQTVERLQQELSARKRETQEFTARFSEHAALTAEVSRLGESYDAARERLAGLEKARPGAGPKLTLLDQPATPRRPVRPDYWRDSALIVAGAGVLGLIAVWFVEFFARSGARGAEPQQHPIIHISYPPGVMIDPANARLPGMQEALPPIAGAAARLPETLASFPRELSVPEARSLWAAAAPQARLVIAGLMGGLSLAELAALRFEHVDSATGSVRVPGISSRGCTLREPLRRLLVERHAAGGGGAVLDGEDGEPLSGADLEGLIACAAHDAGLSNPAEVTAEALRHTYVAWLIRQGARLSEIGEFVGRVPPAAFREYGLLSPPGPGLPMEEVDPVYPALRQPNA